MLLKCRFTLLLHRVFRLGFSIQIYTRTRHEYSVFTVNQLQCSLCFLLGFNIVSELCRYDTSSRFSEKQSTLFWKQCLKTEAEHVTMKLVPLFARTIVPLPRRGCHSLSIATVLKQNPLHVLHIATKVTPRNQRESHKLLVMLLSSEFCFFADLFCFVDRFQTMRSANPVIM